MYPMNVVQSDQLAVKQMNKRNDTQSLRRNGVFSVKKINTKQKTIVKCASRISGVIAFPRSNLNRHPVVVLYKMHKEVIDL